MIDINIKKISFLLNYSTNQAYNKKNNYQPQVLAVIYVNLNILSFMGQSKKDWKSLLLFSDYEQWQ